MRSRGNCAIVRGDYDLGAYQSPIPSLSEIQSGGLPPGLVHVYDVLFPFEYPENWFEKGFALNEASILRSFLIVNNLFEILFWNDYLQKRDAEWLTRNLPGCLKGWSFGHLAPHTEAPR